MKVLKVSTINWLLAMDRLSVGAFYLLNVLYRKDISVSDNSLMEITGYGVSTHRKQKKELLEGSYMVVKQIGKGRYKYLVGEGVNNE